MEIIIHDLGIMHQDATLKKQHDGTPGLGVGGGGLFEGRYPLSNYRLFFTAPLFLRVIDHRSQKSNIINYKSIYKSDSRSSTQLSI